MPSARGLRAVCAGTLPFAVVFTGCASTQTIAARARLVDARTLAAQAPTLVRRPNPAVGVASPVLIHARNGTAIVVALRNESARILTDLPISVGIRTPTGRRVYLNLSGSLDYFESHVTAIGPGGVTTWVFTTRRRVPDGRAFATVGFPHLHPSLAGGLPRLTATSHGSATVSVTNRSAVPQYDVPVYAVAVRAGRDVAAGRATVAHLGSHSRTNVTVTLLGSTRPDELDLVALPTMFS